MESDRATLTEGELIQLKQELENTLSERNDQQLFALVDWCKKHINQYDVVKEILGNEKYSGFKSANYRATCTKPQIRVVTPLVYAIDQGHYRTAILLVDSGFSIKVPGYTPKNPGSKSILDLVQESHLDNPHREDLLKLLKIDLFSVADGDVIIDKRKQADTANIIKNTSDDYLTDNVLLDLIGAIGHAKIAKDELARLAALKAEDPKPKKPASRLFGMLLGGVMGVFLGPVVALSASISRIIALVRHRELWAGKGALDVAYLIFKTLIELIFSPILGGFRGAKLGWRQGIRAGGSASLHYHTGLTYSVINKRTPTSFQLISVSGEMSHLSSVHNILSLSILLSAAVPLVVLSGVFPPLAIISMPVLAVISAAVLTVGVVAAGMTYAVTRFRQAHQLDDMEALSTDASINGSHSVTKTAGEPSRRSSGSVAFQISQGSDGNLSARGSASSSPSSSRRSSMSNPDLEDDGDKSALYADRLGRSVDSSITSESSAISDVERQKKVGEHTERLSQSTMSSEDDDWVFGDDQYDSRGDQSNLKGIFGPKG